MNVAETKQTIMDLALIDAALYGRTTPCLEAPHGVGKSEVIFQCAKELSVLTKKPWEFIDIRLSQREVGDIIGMPRLASTFDVYRRVIKDGKQVEEKHVVSNVTINELPFFFPKDPESCGILFLDELNRATRDVQQAAFELVLDYRLGGNYVMPIGWRIVVAQNPEDKYNVTPSEPALADRLKPFIKFKPTVPDFMKYAEETNFHPLLYKYLLKNPMDLDTPENAVPNETYQSRRSWFKLSNWMHGAESLGKDYLKNDTNYFQKVAQGWLGSALAQSLVEFLTKEGDIFTAEDIFDKYDKKVEAKLKTLVVTDFTYYNKLLIRHVRLNKLKLTAKQQGNLLSYAKVIPMECLAGFWREFRNDCPDESAKWYKIKEVEQLILATLARGIALGGKA